MASNVALFREPFGRPLGLPLIPGRNPLCPLTAAGSLFFMLQIRSGLAAIVLASVFIGPFRCICVGVRHGLGIILRPDFAPIGAITSPLPPWDRPFAPTTNRPRCRRREAPGGG